MQKKRAASAPSTPKWHSVKPDVGGQFIALDYQKCSNQDCMPGAESSTMSDTFQGPGHRSRDGRERLLSFANTPLLLPCG